MKARRREMERRRREKALAQLEREEVLTVRWLRIRGLVLKLLLAVLAVILYWQFQSRYPDNRWPLELVWGMMVVGVFGALGWTLWYLNRGD
jgi:NADH:ubiquinone oxidoreductase subunit 4 (subunit M)